MPLGRRSFASSTDRQQPAVTDPSRAVATEVPDTGDQRGAGNKAGTKSRAGTQAVDAPLQILAGEPESHKPGGYQHALL